MAPTSPYCTAALASILSKHMFRGQTPGANSPVSPTELDQLILWTDSIINGEFSSLGYKIPFVAISGETWPAWQTTSLQIFSAVGAMAMATGYILLPAPAMLPGRVGGDRNAYAIMFEVMKADVRKNGFRFRAQSYPMSKADRIISKAYGPDTDFMRDKWDPTRYELMRDWTDRIRAVFDDIEDIDIDWDYMYGMR